MNTGRRAKGDNTCAACPEPIGRDHALCEPCRKRYSPVSAFDGWVKGEVVFYGPVGSDFDIMTIIRSSDDTYGEIGHGNNRRKLDE
jgi:hypothetical protein